jgi:hypothetical protein
MASQRIDSDRAIGLQPQGLSFGLAWGAALLTAASLYAWQHKRIALAA